MYNESIVRQAHNIETDLNSTVRKTYLLKRLTYENCVRTYSYSSNASVYVCQFCLCRALTLEQFAHYMELLLLL